MEKDYADHLLDNNMYVNEDMFTGKVVVVEDVEVINNLNKQPKTL